MTDQLGKENSDMVCTCGEMHKGHICWLLHMGLLNEVYHLSCSPTISCSKCGAKANLTHNVCFPTPYKRK
jgi:ribosomal protein L32